MSVRDRQTDRHREKERGGEKEKGQKVGKKANKTKQNEQDQLSPFVHTRLPLFDVFVMIIKRVRVIRYTSIVLFLSASFFSFPFFF